MSKGFAKIDSDLQKAYEKCTKPHKSNIPEICGYYGRACRQMGKDEGANRMLCQGCGLAKYCGEEQCL